MCREKTSQAFCNKAWKTRISKELEGASKFPHYWATPVPLRPVKASASYLEETSWTRPPAVFATFIHYGCPMNWRTIKCVLGTDCLSTKKIRARLAKTIHKLRNNLKVRYYWVVYRCESRKTLLEEKKSTFGISLVFYWIIRPRKNVSSPKTSGSGQKKRTVQTAFIKYFGCHGLKW